MFVEKHETYITKPPINYDYEGHFNTVLVVFRFRAWNRFRNRILSFFQKIVIPIPIPVPRATGIDSKVESVPRLESIPELESDPGLE